MIGCQDKATKKEKGSGCSRAWEPMKGVEGSIGSQQLVLRNRYVFDEER